MPKLYFRHGAVSSAKTLNLLAVAHNYKMQGKHVLLLKPEMDSRFGVDFIRSRAGLEQNADVLIGASTNLLSLPEQRYKGVHCVLVDEVQFLDPKHIDQLRAITLLWSVPVICYGLRTDFRTRLFPGSQRLLELADSIEEVKTTCQFCNRKAVFNLKHVNGKADVSGPAVQLGAEEKYFPTCHICYRANVLDANEGESIGFTCGDCAADPKTVKDAAGHPVPATEAIALPDAASVKVSKSDDEEDP